MERRPSELPNFLKTCGGELRKGLFPLAQRLLIPREFWLLPANVVVFECQSERG